IELISFKDGDLCKYSSGAFVMKVTIEEISKDKKTAKVKILSLLQNGTGSKLIEEAFKDLVKDEMTLQVSTSKLTIFTLLSS
ncbi:MAG: hypothetical protein RI945_101, partial [Candidatus Parcubacteria bacterium]